PAAAQPDKGDKGHGKGGGGGPPPHAQGGGGGPPGGGGGGPPAGNPGRGGGPDTVVVSQRDRDVVYSYYRTEYNAGNCPPGLAKKNNGCLPPGQAKKMWTIGRPLPSGVYYEALPPSLLGRLSPAPAGYQYVRVANDVLMLAVGTRMVMSAIADLSRF
ncbi:MAG TPA: hypothetical protein VEC60_10835, partial [Reyranella sp.]|nr:hypothetical protein [Reyranella sp.]